VLWVRKDRRHAEVAGRLVGRVVPRLARRLPVERREERPRDAAVGALEDAGVLGAGEEAPVRGGEARDLRQLQPAVVVGEALARLLPRLPEVGAAPDARTVPLARGSGEEGARVGVPDHVVDRPALAEWSAHG